MNPPRSNTSTTAGTTTTRSSSITAATTTTTTTSNRRNDDDNMGAFLFCYSRKEDSVEQKLRQNQEHFTDLQLWLNSDTKIWDLTDALEQNTTVQQVCLLIHESFGDNHADTDGTIIVDAHPAAADGQQQHALHHQHNDHDENSTGTTVTGHTDQINQSLLVQERHHNHLIGASANSNHNDVLALFRALGGLPQLRRLFANTYRFPFVAKLPIQAIASLFDRRQPPIIQQSIPMPLPKNNLVEFKLWRTDLTASKSDHDDAEQHMLEWSNAMVLNCHNLREFRLIKCRLILQNNNNSNNSNNNATDTAHDQSQETSPTQQRRRQGPIQRNETSSTASAKTTTTTNTTAVATSSLLDPLLQGLSKLPFLQDVELTATELSDLGSLSPPALSQLLKDAPNLQSFSLSNFDLSEDAVLAIANGLIMEEQLHCHRHPPSNNKEPKSIQSQQIKPSTTNNTLPGKTSHVRHVKLSKVGITASMFRKPLREAFHTVLESNYHLGSLFLFDERNLQEEIAFYTKLNRLGRLRLLQQNDTAYYNAPLCNDDSSTIHNNQEWIELLLQVQHDLPVLYYFVRVNPLILCNTSHESVPSNIPTIKSKHMVS